MTKEDFLERFELVEPTNLKEFVICLEKIGSQYSNTKMAILQMYDFSNLFSPLAKQFIEKLKISNREQFLNKLTRIKTRSRDGVKKLQKQQSVQARFDIIWDDLIRNYGVNESLKIRNILNEISDKNVYYHGSYNDFETFKNKTGTLSSFDYKNPIFLSTDSDFAKEYAKSKGGILYTVKLDNNVNIFDFRLLPTGADLDLFNRTGKKTDNSRDYKLGNMVDEMLMDEDRTDDYYYLLLGDYGVIEQTYFMDFLKKNKFDGAYVMETGTLNLYIFDPSHVKIIKKDYIN
jgi:hypothetical protein